jgi:hypothetical protein
LISIEVNSAPEENMTLEKSKIIPAAFWVGFLALGFVTSVGGPNKHRVIDQAATWSARTVAAPHALLAQAEPPNASINMKPVRTDHKMR